MSTLHNLEVGRRFVCGSVLLTDEHREAVVGIGGYVHPLFADPDFARDNSPFAALPVPGELTLFLLGGLAEQSGLFEDDIVALVAIDEVRFPSPAILGDTITLEMEVERQHRRSGGSTATVDLRWRAVNQTGVEVLTCRVKMLVRVE